MIQDVLRDFVLYNGADKMVGRVDEFQPPALKRVVESFRGAGMDGSMPIDMGMEPLEASWTTSGIDRGTYAGFGLMNALRTTAILRGAVVDPVTGIPKPVIHTLVGDLTVVEPSGYKPGERATLKTTMVCLYYKLTHTLPGLPLIEIDIVNGVRIINGVDQLLALRLLVGR
jgi:uncharacterized protein